MSTDAASPPTVARSAKPVPYVPFAALDSFLGTLKELPTVPNSIAKDMMVGMSGGTQSHLFTALKSLHLIDDNGKSQPMLSNLVMAHGTPEWRETLGAFIKEEYADVIGDLNITSAAQSQLRKCFADQSPAIRDKAVRFYLNALKSAGTEFSPMFTKRKQRTKGSATKKSGAPREESNNGDGAPHVVRTEHTTPKGMIEFPIPLGNQMGMIRVPQTLTAEQFPMVAAMLNAVKVFAESNSSKAEGRRESISDAT